MGGAYPKASRFARPLLSEPLRWAQPMHADVSGSGLEPARPLAPVLGPEGAHWGRPMRTGGETSL